MPSPAYPTPFYRGNYPGYYYNNPYAPNYPMYSGMPYAMGAPMPALVPIPGAGGFFSINRGGARFNYWRASSGYYYPWCAQPYYYPSNTIIYMQEGSSEPAQPPVTTMFSDMSKYLQEAKDKGKVSEGEYSHLMLRLSDLMKMELSARQAGDGALSPADENEIRSKVNDLSLEIAHAVKL